MRGSVAAAALAHSEQRQRRCAPPSVCALETDGDGAGARRARHDDDRFDDAVRRSGESHRQDLEDGSRQGCTPSVPGASSEIRSDDEASVGLFGEPACQLVHVAHTREHLDRALQQESLFGDATPPELKPPRFIAKYHYFCETADCPGHKQRILDWELTAF